MEGPEAWYAKDYKGRESEYVTVLNEQYISELTNAIQVTERACPAPQAHRVCDPAISAAALTVLRRIRLLHLETTRMHVLHPSSNHC